MATFVAQSSSDNSSSPGASSSAASSFTTPESDSPCGSRRTDKTVPTWDGRADHWAVSFGTAVNMVDRQPSFQAMGPHQRYTMPADPRQHYWQQQQQQQQQSTYSSAGAAGGVDRVLVEDGRGLMYNQRYLESSRWRSPSAIGVANNPMPLSAPPNPEYNMLAWHQQQQQQQRPHQGFSGMESFYAYCFDRGNGNYTRLIPADMIPPLLNIPAIQSGADGMFVLPMPLRPPPSGPLSNIEPVTIIKTPPPSPEPGADTIQKKIDHIVATTPNPQKKPKIYCDKWVHEGVCAFTQQGCKYKHEMPMDKTTQMSLGLFHGLPTWWKKQQMEKQREQPDAGAMNMGFSNDNGSGSGGTGPGASSMANTRCSGLASPGALRAPQAVSWRRPESVGTAGPTPTMTPPFGGGNSCTAAMASSAYAPNMSGFRSSAAEARPFPRQSSSPTSPCLFGPIGPPSRYGGADSGPTSYPSASMSRGRSGDEVQEGAASMEVENLEALDLLDATGEHGWVDQQRQLPSEDLARLEHLQIR